MDEPQPQPPQPETPAQPRPRRDRAWVWVALGFVLLWVVYLAFFGPRRAGHVAQEGQVVNLSWSLKRPDGTRFDLASYRGRPIFLNVWATWCGPCVAEMPSISRLASNPRVKDVAFLCVSVDDSEEAVTRFLRTNPVKTPIALSLGSPPDAFFSEAIPVTFLIAPDGRIVQRVVGSTDWDRPEVVEALEKLARSDARSPRPAD